MQRFYLVRVPSNDMTFLAKGCLWVDFFFLPSGYLTAHVYADEFRDRFSLPKARPSIFARFSRIYALHPPILLAYLVLEFAKLALVTFDVGHASFPIFDGAQRRVARRLALREGRVSRALSRPVLLWPRAISYSVYLSHMLILSVINVTSVTLISRTIGGFLDTASSLLVLAVLLVAVLTLSAWIYAHVEVPARRVLGQGRFARRFIHP